MARPKRIKEHVPALTLLIVGVSMSTYSFPQISELLVYDRQAILSGELWRLLTAPCVHFSASHMFWNLAVFGAAGCAIEAAGYRGLWLVCGFAAGIPSLIFLQTLPELERYGGLSGLATGAVAYFCLCRAFKTRRTRTIWLVILAVTGTKILVEVAMDAPIFVQTDRILFRVLPSVHIFGYLGALAAIVWTWPNKSIHLSSAIK